MEESIVVNRIDAEKSSSHEGKVGRDVYLLQETRNLVSGITVVYPHRQTKGHIHPDREEHYYVLSGSGYLLLDDVRHDIKTGDGISIPPVSLHTIVNPNDEPLEFFWAAFPDEPKIAP